MTQQRYALQDDQTNHILWIGEAASPEAACALATRALGGIGYWTYFKASGIPEEVEEVYYVYAAPPGFTVQDGKDSATIAAVEALPFVGAYIWDTDADRERILRMPMDTKDDFASVIVAMRVAELLDRAALLLSTKAAGLWVEDPESVQLYAECHDTAQSLKHWARQIEV